MAVYSYDLKNVKRDLSDVLSTVIAQQPRFISLFGRKADATNTTHEWLEDGISGRSITAASVSDTTVTVSYRKLSKICNPQL